MRTRNPWIAAAALVTILLGAGLSGMTGMARPNASGPASISVISAAGTTAHPQVVQQGGVLTITVSVQNFTLDAGHIGSRANMPGHGHYQVYVDSFDPASPTKFLVQSGATTTIKISLAALARKGISIGVHTLYVVLANNNNSLVIPLAIASTVILIVTPPPPAPSLSITTPIGTVTDPQQESPSGTFTFTVAPHNFVFDPAHIGSSINKPGSGHYHIFADSIDPTQSFRFWVGTGATQNVTVDLNELAKAGVTTGTHTLYVALANNNHSLLKPLVFISTVIRIGPAVRIDMANTPNQALPIQAHGRITLHVSATNFHWDAAAIGSKTNQLGSGHYHVYLDSFDPNKPFLHYLTASAAPTVDITADALLRAGAVPGIHQIYVVLANNDHSLVSPLTGANVVVFLGR